MKKISQLVVMAGFLLFSSCGTYFNQPFSYQPSRTGEYTASTGPLMNLPAAADPVEVAVYNFSDQTGQYKAIENGSTFSTAVSQGATTILIKALEDSGWFIPIERENLSNLSTERNIIRNTKQEYIKNLNPNEPPLPPLLYAGLLLEGGIISYDTNIVTGGIGARYFGLGGSAKYRQDRITVYLRAVSTSNGEILKTIYVSKTILSQALDGNFFRYVKFQRLFEAETGITRNEPLHMAVKDAIEKAVHDLIVEGIEDKFWNSAEGEETDQRLITQYQAEKNEDEATGLYNRIFVDRKFKNKLSFSGGVALMDGDYKNKELGYLGKLGYQKKITPHFSMGLNASLLQLNNGKQFKNSFGTIDINAHVDLLPQDDLSPFLYGGPGYMMEISTSESEDLNFGESYFKMQYGAGIQYYLSERIGLKIFAEHNLTFSDRLDRFENGKRDDYYFNFGIGLNYFFGNSGNQEENIN